MSALELATQSVNRRYSDNGKYLYGTDGDRIDLTPEPVVEPMNLLDTATNDLVKRNNNDFVYSYFGIKVPRVSAVLNYCNGNIDHLMSWASKLGHKYKFSRNRTLDIGSKAHEAIAEYMTEGSLHTLKTVSGSEKQDVKNAVNSFMGWYNHVTLNLGWKVEVLVSEFTLLSPWFGGTTDAILIINGRKFVVDFKTSKRLNEKYFIQVAAYLWILDNYYPDLGPIEGVGLLRFDKSNGTYEDIFLERNDPQDAEYIHHCQQIFFMALNMFYAMNTFVTETNATRERRKKTSNRGLVSEGLALDPVIDKRKQMKKEFERMNKEVS
jgi:hypothetical protein